MMFDDWVMEIEWVREPEARHTVSTHSGMIPDMESIEIGDTMWLKMGDDWMQIPSGPSGEEAAAQQEFQLDFEDMLKSLESDMTPAGTETVDNIHCQKYTFDTDYAMPFPIPDDASEEALQSSEARLRKIIEKNADGIIIVNRDKIVLFTNPAAETLFDCAAEDLVCKPFTLGCLADAITELEIPGNNGKRLVEMNAVETEWENDIAYLATLRDVTELKRAKKKEDLLANLFENAQHEMILVVETGGQIIM